LHKLAAQFLDFRRKPMGEMTTIRALDEDATFGAYVAKPAGQAKAAIIVIPEIFGVNAGIRQKCEHWAGAGYLAIAIDIFWRFAPGVELDPDVEAELHEGFGYFQQYDPATGVKDIEASIHAIRRGELGLDPIEKVGCVGYCLGGRLAYMAAARTDISASVGYYGVMIDTMLNESHAIANPLMLHIPTADGFVGPEAQAAIHAGLDDHPKVVLHDYAGLDHGFAAEMGNRRDDAGAQLADGRTAAFFAEWLV
jgi:carboxymethylenebutenolidase